MFIQLKARNSVVYVTAVCRQNSSSRQKLSWLRRYIHLCENGNEPSGSVNCRYFLNRWAGITFWTKTCICSSCVSVQTPACSGQNSSVCRCQFWVDQSPQIYLKGPPSVIVGWFAGRTWKSNNKWNAQPPKLLSDVYSIYTIYKFGWGRVITTRRAPDWRRMASILPFFFFLSYWQCIRVSVAACSRRLCVSLEGIFIFRCCLIGCPRRDGTEAKTQQECSYGLVLTTVLARYYQEAGKQDEKMRRIEGYNNMWNSD